MSYQPPAGQPPGYAYGNAGYGAPPGPPLPSRPGGPPSQGAPPGGGPPQGGPPGGPVQYTGQQETYQPSTFGPQVPRAELSNPQGIIHCGDLSLTVDGGLVPVVDVMLGPGLRIYFEHHILLWKHPSVNITFQSLSGAFKRFFAGMQIFQTEAAGPGNISFSRDSVGQIVCLRLQPGQTVEVREHQFCLATSNVDYSVTTFSGISNMLFSRSGLLIDTFTCRPGGHDGLVVLHGYGNVFEKQLVPGEALDVEPGAWLWKDPSVQMQTINAMQSGGNQGGGLTGGRGHGFFSRLESAIGNVVSGGGSLFLNRMYGPGRVGLQSMTYHPPQPEGAPQAGGSNNLGGFLGQLG